MQKMPFETAPPRSAPPDKNKQVRNHNPVEYCFATGILGHLDIIKTWVAPNGFPEKIQPLLQAINLAEFVIFFVDKLDKFTGEQIIALDSLKKEKGILSHSYEVDESKLDSMIKGTVLENYTKVDQDKIKEEIDKIEPILKEGPSEMVVDHCFDVKGVGTVILGKVTVGKIKQYFFS